ncbi:MAG: CapA family protein [Leptospira sp.]|nr:CapA family protein [Leptospira sp.]
MTSNCIKSAGVFVFLTFFCFESGSEPVAIRKTKILLGGDVMFNWGIEESKKKFGRNSALIGLRQIFAEADFRIVNLETPIIESALSDPEKPYVFHAKDEDLLSLRDIGVDMVFLGNNHTMDYGSRGLLETFDFLSGFGIEYAGAGKNIVEAFSPKLVSISGTTFSFSSVSAIGERRLFAKSGSRGAAPFEMDRIKRIPAKNKKKYPEIISVHWGQEYRPYPYQSQVRNAHTLIDTGFKAVIGHHPHIPQGIEKYKGGIIFYSLGNLIFGSRNQYLNHNLLAILHFENRELVLCEIIPVFGKFQNSDHIVYPLIGDAAENFLKEISVLSEPFKTKIEIKNGRGYVFFRKDK